MLTAFAIVASTIVLVFIWWDRQHDPKALREARMARVLVTVSARVSGPKNNDLAIDWTADLAGTPEEGRLLSPGQQLRYGCGCLSAAVRLRIGDLVDEVLTSRAGSNAVIAGTVTLAAVLLIRSEGLSALVLHAGDLARVGGLAIAAVQAPRRWRDVRPAPRRRRDHSS